MESVAFRSRARRRFRLAAGLECWRANVRLRIGHNAVRIRAADVEGSRSAVRRVIVLRSRPQARSG